MRPKVACTNLRAAVFLDRDGTLIEDRGHLRDPSEVVSFPQTLNALRHLQEHDSHEMRRSGSRQTGSQLDVSARAQTESTTQMIAFRGFDAAGDDSESDDLPLYQAERPLAWDLLRRP